MKWPEYKQIRTAQYEYVLFIVDLNGYLRQICLSYIYSNIIKLNLEIPFNCIIRYFPN